MPQEYSFVFYLSALNARIAISQKILQIIFHTAFFYIFIIIFLKIPKF